MLLFCVLCSFTSSVFFLFSFVFFFFNDTATTEIYTLSLHDALPISWLVWPATCPIPAATKPKPRDRKSTRLNSSHPSISYAVFCLKKKKQKQNKSSNTQKKKKRKKNNNKANP